MIRDWIRELLLALSMEHVVKSHDQIEREVCWIETFLIPVPR